MEWKSGNTKTLIAILVTGFILLSNFVVLIDFTVAQEKSCCESECQCKIEHECDMTIECGSAQVVILIPLLRIDEENDLLNVIESEVYTEIQEFPQLINYNRLYKSTPVLITPSTYTNTPLLI